MGAKQSKIDEFFVLTTNSSQALMQREIGQLCGLDQRDNTTHIEQLLKCLESVRGDESRMILFFEIGKLYIRQDHNKAVDYIKKSLELAESAENNEYRGQILWILGEIYVLLRKSKDAIHFYSKYLDIWENISKPISKSKIFWSISIAYMMITDYEKALEYDMKYSEAYKIENADSSVVVSDPLFEYDTSSLSGNQESPTRSFCGMMGFNMTLASKRLINVDIIKYSGVEMRYEQRYSDAILYFKWLLNISKKVNDKDLEIKALFYLQDTYRRLSRQKVKLPNSVVNSELIKEANLKCRQYCRMRVEIGPNSELEHTSIESLIRKYEKEGRYRDRLIVYTENLRKYIDDVNRIYVKNAHVELASVYTCLRRFKESIPHYWKAYYMSDGNSKTVMLASIAYNLYRMSRELENYPIALKCLENYLIFIERMNLDIQRFTCYTVLIEICTYKLHEYDLGHKYATELGEENFGCSKLNDDAKRFANKYCQKIRDLQNRLGRSNNTEVKASESSMSEINITPADCSAQSSLQQVDSLSIDRELEKSDDDMDILSEMDILTPNDTILSLSLFQDQSMESYKEKSKVLEEEFRTFTFFFAEYEKETTSVSDVEMNSK